MVYRCGAVQHARRWETLWVSGRGRYTCEQSKESFWVTVCALPAAYALSWTGASSSLDLIACMAGYPV